MYACLICMFVCHITLRRVCRVWKFQGQAWSRRNIFGRIRGPNLPAKILPRGSKGYMKGHHVFENL